MRALVAELPAELRELRVATLAHTMASGVPVDPLALTVVLSALDEACEEPLVVRRGDIDELLWIGVEQLCREAELDTPSGCVAALHACLALALTTDRLRPGSDTPDELFDPIRQMRLV